MQVRCGLRKIFIPQLMNVSHLNAFFAVRKSIHPYSIFAPMKILMVCLGNICRSPLAEGILRAKFVTAGLHWEVDSAGTHGYHAGEAPHRLSQKVAAANGIDISG